MRVLSQANLSLTGGMLPIKWNLDTSIPADSKWSVLCLTGAPFLTIYL